MEGNAAKKPPQYNVNTLKEEDQGGEGAGEPEGNEREKEEESRENKPNGFPTPSSALTSELNF